MDTEDGILWHVHIRQAVCQTSGTENSEFHRYSFWLLSYISNGGRYWEKLIYRQEIDKYFVEKAPI